MSEKNATVSFVFPVYNEEGNIEVLYRQVKDACRDSAVDYQMVFVDNGSCDGSLGLIKGLRKRDKNVTYISLARNFGHQGALFAGMCYSNGDAVVTMDADLQHPPSLIPQMVELWKKGVEVVYTTKEGHNLQPVKYFMVKVFYWLISKISRLKLYFGQSDFRLIDRKVLKAILEMPEYHKFLRGQVNWAGFRQEGLTYNVLDRHSGNSKFSYFDLFSFALDGIFAFSRYPLHLVMLVGLIISMFSFLYICYVCVVWVIEFLNIPLSIPFPRGWGTLAVSILFLSSIQLIAMGMLGEYVGRIYDQVKGRPVFIIRESSDSEKE